MANERLPAPSLPKPPNTAPPLVPWARDITRVLATSLQRIVTNLNEAVPLSGTWSPGVSADTAAGTATYTHRRGRWTLNGQEVSIWGDVLISAWTGSPSGNLRIHGLPFVHTSDTPETVGVALPRSGLALTPNYTQIVAVLQTNSQNLRFHEWGSGQSSLLIQASAVSLPFRIEFHVRYRKRFDAVATPDA